MKTKIRIIPDLKNSASLTMNPALAAKLGIINKKIGFIRFGIRTTEVKIKNSNELSMEELTLSEQLIKNLSLPTNLDFEVIIRDNEIILGPFIGILATRKEERLNEIINSLSNYVYDYENIGGAILAFSIEGIEESTQTIRGYLYNPNKKTWEIGIYPYPASLFKRIGMCKKWRNHFQSYLGNCIFNDYLLNKWEMYRWLNQFPLVKEHLPDSILYKKPKDIRWFLELYNRVYIKPIYGSQGLGVMEATKRGSKIIVKYLERGITKELTFENSTLAARFFRTKLIGKYIIQRAISLITLEEMKIDFRVLLLKNQYGLWEDVGLIARYGKVGSIVSNISAGGKAVVGELSLSQDLKKTNEDVIKIRKEMSQIAIDAAKSLEECGINCGNLGVDMAIDVDGLLWIIEINNKDPNHTIAIDAGDRQMFYRTKLAAMLYAKKLAGFAEG